MKRTERGFFLQKHDNSLLVQLTDITSALGLLTRLPVQVDSDAAQHRGANAAWAFPVVGIMIAVITAIVASIALLLGINVQIAAALSLFTQIVLTGAMHEDGLADSADGLWGGWDKERRLEIMKDSRIGAYGVIALVFSILVRWFAISTIIGTGSFVWVLIAIAALSRSNMVILMGFLQNARNSGLSQSVGQPVAATVNISVAIAASIALITVTRHLPLVLLVTALSALVCAAIARRKIGGQTGDILGATQQITEIALLVCLATVLA